MSELEFNHILLASNEGAGPLQSESLALRYMAERKQEGNSQGANQGASQGGVLNGFQDLVAEVPKPVVMTAGIASGFLSRVPGKIGLIGKIAAGTLGVTLGTDLTVRATGLNPRADDTDGMVRDGLGLFGIAGAWGMGRRLSAAPTRQFEPRPGLFTGWLGRGRLGAADKAAVNETSAIIKEGTSDGAIPLKSPGWTGEERRPISEEAIARFDAGKQKEIKAEIDRLVKNGRPLQYLDLWPSGDVTYNSTAHMNALELEAMKAQGK